MSQHYDHLATMFGFEKAMEIAEAASGWIQKKKDEDEFTQFFVMAPPVSFGPNRIWSVSDCRSNCKSGMWALTSTEEGCYGVNIHARMKSSPNSQMQITLASGETVAVSKKVYEPIMKIKKGDTLFMADKYRERVFKGVVLEEILVKLGNSFNQRVRNREVVAGRPITQHSSPPPPFENVEALFPKVSWKNYAAITDPWNKYLNSTNIRPTVIPLTVPHPS